MFLKSTKLFDRMPCAHAQFFDGEDYNGACAKFHGYSRSFKFEFSGIPDQYGWVVGFGDLKVVRKFLEYYFDHTAIAPANDPRMGKIMKAMEDKLIDLRVLPYGVSMEMSALFVWEIVNAYIVHKYNERCFVSRLEVIEHQPNSGILEVNYKQALTSARSIIEGTPLKTSEDLLVQRQFWPEKPIRDTSIRTWEV